MLARFLIRRLLVMLPMLAGITFIVFAVMALAPGDPFAEMRMNPSFSPDTIAALEREFGFGQPLFVRYAKWLWQALHFDLGLSVAYRVPVSGLIAMRAVNTLILAVTSIGLSWTLAVPIGIHAALHPRSFADRALSLLAFLGMSVPNFFFAFVLMYLALRTGWFPVGGTTSIGYDALSPAAKLLDRAHHLVLPVVVLGTSGMASLMRLMRGQILAIRDADFVRTARAKGLPERRVVWMHILRNALNPFVTLAGYELGTLLSGAALVEAVMNLQGLGTLLLEAVRSLDVYLVMGSVLMGSVLLLLGNLLADLALTAVDPRIGFARLEGAR
jgi:peptide/nickel transport system permease protein